MVKTLNIQAEQASFKDYLFKYRRNRTILYLAGVAIVIQFALFKYLYPYASYIHGDSFSYIDAAFDNSSINTYPIGYSKFLRFFSVFSKSDFVLVAFQYLLLQCSVLFLLFTLFYFYKPQKITQIILLCFMVFNPLFFHLGNLVSSDGFFLSLSMIWFALLLWIIHKPSKRIILYHALILFILFTVRYNAIIYPFISSIAFWLSKQSIRNKIIGLGIGIGCCIYFILFTSYKYKQLTGNWQYSPFSGWQLANNAMYAYRYVDGAHRNQVNKKFEVLDNMIRQYFDTTKDIKRFPHEALQASTVYMWTPGLPLYKYRDLQFKHDTSANEFKKWASMGPIFKEYGLTIIMMYPGKFMRYFVWPNLRKYYAPPVEFLATYNSGKKYVTIKTENWFDYKSQIIGTRMKNQRVFVLSFYPILSGIINAVMLCSLISFLLLKGAKEGEIKSKGILLAGIVWLLNAVFTIFASSAALRFQSFPILLTTIFVALLIEWLYNLSTNLQLENDKILENKRERINLSEILFD